MFVADFIGSPPMNFLHFEGGSRSGATHLRPGRRDIAMPEIARGARRPLVLGVRPEHVGSTTTAPIAARCGGRISRHDPDRHARHAAWAGQGAVPSSRHARRRATVGLAFAPGTLSLFDAGTGRALRRAAANEGEAAHG
jgi:multiple sugar transport system ATP-binding protein